MALGWQPIARLNLSSADLDEINKKAERDIHSAFATLRTVI
jgi:hypothetical protein